MTEFIKTDVLSRRAVLRMASAAGATLMATSLVACGSTAATATVTTVTQTVTKASVSTATVAKTVVKASTQTVTATGKVTLLRISELDNTTQLDVSRRIVKSFMEDHPNITVKVEPVAGDYATKIYVQAAANTLPDVIWTADVYTQPFATKHIAKNMQPYADRDKSFNLDDIYPQMLSLGRTALRPGGLFMLPRALDILLLFYNKTMFQDAGVALPTPTWTINDLIQAAHKLTKPSNNPKTAQYGINLSWTWWAEYVPWMRGYGGDIVSTDGKKFIGDQSNAVAGIQAMADLILKEQVAPRLGMSFGGDPFVTGHVAMTHTIRDSVPGYRRDIGSRFEWDVQIWPAFPKKHVTGMGTQGYTMTTDTKVPDQAWELAKYYVSVAGQRILASTYSTVPVLISMAKDPSWYKLPPPPNNNAAFTESAKFGTLPPVFPPGCGSVYTGQIDQVMTNTLDKILRGSVDAQTGLTQAASQINACLVQHGA
jgi:multiple sugar transport system substrate-binding protein